MSSDSTPRRPDEWDDLNASTNRGGQDGPSTESDRSDGATPGTTQMPRVEVEPTPVADEAPAQQYPFVPTTEVSTRTVVKTKTKKIPVFIASLAGVVVGAVLVVALIMSGAFRITSSSTDSDDSSSTTQTIEIDAEDVTLAEVVAAKALPSVASITVETADGSGVGSGVVLDTDGNIITNYHVIEDAVTITVTLNGSSYEAEVVGSDTSSDLAVIRVLDADEDDLVPIEIGDSDDLSVGEWVMAIGSPFGNEQSVSTGIVSALYRSTALPSASGSTIYANMIQTDAAINPGNSGGALVNAEGQLIGINSIIESYSGSSSGVGFAIPVNYAINIANQIIAGETPAHPYLGVSVSTVTATTASQYGLTVSEGALINAVTEGTPAEEAGLEAGDVVTAVDDDEVTSADSLIILLREHEIGETVTLTVVRDGEELSIDVTLGSDAELQTEEQDSSSGSSSMTQDEFLEYLEDLLGNRSQS